MANKGEWSEPYVAIRVLGEGKLYLADENGNKNNFEWMDIIELIRHETATRIVKYKYNEIPTDIVVNINNKNIKNFFIISPKILIVR